MFRLVQTSENGEAFHVYTANSHNHPIASTKGIKGLNRFFVGRFIFIFAKLKKTIQFKEKIAIKMLSIRPISM
jgi:hypothetical protein